MKERVELLLQKYKDNASEQNFANLFTECHRILVRFLLSKNMQFDDAEDLLQDFFIKEFDKSIETYREDTNRSFSAYLQHIIFLRFLSFYDGSKRRKIYSLSNTEVLEAPSSSIAQGDFVRELMLKEVRDLFRGLVLGIKNENHRNAFILKLCMPIKISAEEAALIMNSTVSTYTTWLYRATLAFKQRIEEKKNEGLINFNFEDIEVLLKQKTFSFNRETIDKIKDLRYRTVLHLYFFEKKDIIDISKQLDLKEEKIFTFFRQGMFALLALLNRKDILLRRGKAIMLNQDDILNFIESLERHSEEDFIRRSSVTTGDRDLDRTLRIVYGIFVKEVKNIKKPLSTKEQFLNIVAENKLSLKEVGEKLNLSNRDIQAVLGENLSNIELRRKIHSFIDNFGEGLSDTKEKYDQVSFDKANRELLDRYYKEKK